ncbi:MAG TPA: hypothetical protein VK796_11990 [Cytophaga sp.]|nr:hypothetical protein [Cytophaga sp.]
MLHVLNFTFLQNPILLNIENNTQTLKREMNVGCFYMKAAINAVPSVDLAKCCTDDS